MKKIFLTIFFLILLIFSGITSVRAAPGDPPSAEDVFNKMGACGKLNQACCDLSDTQLPKLGFNLPSPFDIIVAPINALISTATGSIEKALSVIKKWLFGTFDIGATDKLICGENLTPSDKVDPNSCLCLDKKLENISRLCLLVGTGEQASCLSCITDKKGIWTALGCIESDITKFIGNAILYWGIGLGGGFALLCIIYAAFMMQSSQGNPEKLKKAQEMITSCIMGLMLIIFSVFILKLIGVNILKIPGFG